VRFSGSLDLQFYTNLDGEGPGVMGRVQLARTTGQRPLLGVIDISGQFLLEFNSYSTKRRRSFQLPDQQGADPSYSGTQPNILATDPNTGFFVFGDITIDPGFRWCWRAC
jgi:hypothetical protein